jgi:all-trans-retinol 13,14-reductase
MRYDVVIIGSGFGGLACGCQLARTGKRILILERQAQPGGCLQSYRRKGISFDTGLHYIGGLGDGQPLNELFRQLGLLHLPWQRLDANGFDQVTIGGQTFCFAEGYTAFVDQMSAYFPHERQALQTYVEMLQATALPENRAQLIDTNAYQWLCDTFHDPLLINVLGGTALKMELRRESLPLFTFAHGQNSYRQSSWRLRGDGNLLVQALVDNLRSQGGNLVCNAEVESLSVEDGRIVAACCQNGTAYEADTFISDVHPALTFDWIKTPGVVKPLFRRRIQTLENTFGMFTVSLVLKAQALPYFNHNKFVFEEPRVWEQPAMDRVMVSCRIPDNGTYTRQVDLLTPMMWEQCRQWLGTSVGHRGNDYKAMKAEWAAQCIRLAERVIPGLSEMVEDCYTSTPLTWHDYTLTPDGSAYGIRKDCRQSMMTLLSPSTPVPNLFLTGQSLMLHGLEGVAMTAVDTLQKMTNANHL